MSFLWFFLESVDSTNALPHPPGIALDSGRWWGAAGAALISGAFTWKFATWVYVDFIRPRFDRFVSDARRRRPDDEDAIRLESRGRTFDREDNLLLAAIERIAPAHDRLVLTALERTAPELRDLLRDTVLREDFERAKSRDENAARALSIAEACSTALEGISAAQLAQGRALGELPRMAGVMETFAGTVGRMDETLREVNARLEDMAREQGRTAGALEEMRRGYIGPEHRDAIPGRRAEDRSRMASFIEHPPTGDGTDPSTG